MPSAFLERFEAMVRELRAHPEVEVHAVVVNPPASPAAIDQAEAAIGRALPDELRAFYQAHDGVFLEWGLRSDGALHRTVPFGYPDYEQPRGCINLLPVATAMSMEWEAEAHVNEIQPEQWLAMYGAVPDPPPRCGAVCFDNYSKYNHGDLLLGPELLAVVSSDHGADMESSDHVMFSTYLDLTLALYGIDRYRHGLGTGRRPTRVDRWTRRLTLDAAISATRS